MGAWKIGLSAVGILTLGTACSLNPYGESVNVRLEIGNGASVSGFSQRASNLSRTFMGPQAMSGASNFTVDSFDCLMVNISGPGIPMMGNPKEAYAAYPDVHMPRPGATCTYPSVYSKLVNASTGGAIELKIPAGPARKVQVIGIATSTSGAAAGCSVAGIDYLNVLQSYWSVGTEANFPEAVLGESVVDLYGDSTVEVRNSFDPLNWKKPFPCEGEGEGMGGGAGGIQSIAATKNTHSVCVVVSGMVKCWGDASFGQLGYGGTSGTPIYSNGQAVMIDATTYLTGVEEIKAGGFHFCARTNTGRLYCWGDNYYGQIGNGTSSNVQPWAHLVLEGVNQFGLGREHTCASTGPAGLYCWGNNSVQQLGDAGPGSYSSSLFYVPHSGVLSNITSIAAGDQNTCVVDSGQVKCWGWAMEGVLGFGDTAGSSRSAAEATPVLYGGVELSNMVQVSLAGNTACGVSSSGQVYCWGRGEMGQMGNGTAGSANLQAVAASVTGAWKVDVSGGGHVCAVGHSGFQCWGAASMGQLGDGLVAGYPSPGHYASPVQAILENGYTVATGMNFSCALVPWGIACWGENNSGQLGTGDTNQRSAPTGVSIPF